MSEQDNLNIVRKVFESFNNHKPDAADQYFSDPIQTIIGDTPQSMSKEQSRLANQSLMSAIPDLHFDLKDFIAQGDKVSVSYVLRGTHDGSLEIPSGITVPATHKSVHLPGVSVFELHNGMIIRHDIYYDLVTLLRQVGLITPEMLTSRMQR